MILLDTCVISESLKPHPNPSVLEWIASLTESQVYVPALVIGELHKGLRLLPSGKKRQALGVWLDQLEERFAGRILSIDHEASVIWGKLSADLELAGHPLPAVDVMLAALALRHNALFATRNIAHFEHTGVELVNPWN